MCFKENAVCRSVVGMFIVAVSCSAAADAEAQTVAAWIEPVWDADKGLYTYGPLYWDLEVAPSSAGSDEFSLYMYYNRAKALMAATVTCRDAGEEFTIHARSFSGEHFLSLTTGLVPGRECVLFLVGGSDQDERLAYRMAVSERVTRPTDEREVSSALPRLESVDGAGTGALSPIVSRTLRHVARAIVNGGRE